VPTQARGACFTGGGGGRDTEGIKIPRSRRPGKKLGRFSTRESKYPGEKSFQRKKKMVQLRNKGGGGSFKSVKTALEPFPRSSALRKGGSRITQGKNNCLSGQGGKRGLQFLVLIEGAIVRRQEGVQTGNDWGRHFQPNSKKRAP